MVDRARGAGTDIDGTYPYQIAEARIDRIEPGTGVNGRVDEPMAERSMNEVNSGRSASGARLRESGDATPLGAIVCLSLAAAPAFALMALMTATQPGGPNDILCSVGYGSSALGGMPLMYALMGIFHVSPWVRLFSRRWSR